MCFTWRSGVWLNQGAMKYKEKITLYEIEWHLYLEDRTISKKYRINLEEAEKKYQYMRNILGQYDEIALFKKEYSFKEDGELNCCSESYTCRLRQEKNNPPVK